MHGVMIAIIVGVTLSWGMAWGNVGDMCTAENGLTKTAYGELEGCKERCNDNITGCLRRCENRDRGLDCRTICEGVAEKCEDRCERQYGRRRER